MTLSQWLKRRLGIKKRKTIFHPYRNNYIKRVARSNNIFSPTFWRKQGYKL